MFTVSLSDQQTYKVNFSHNSDHWDSTLYHDRKGFTICRLIDTKTEEIYDHAFAWCSIKDRFNKNTGRKISLARVIKKFPRDTRRLFWDAYFKRLGEIK